MPEIDDIVVQRLRLPLSRKNLKDLQELQSSLYHTSAILSQKQVTMAVRSRCALIVVAKDSEGAIVAKGTVCLSRDELGVAARFENIIVAKTHRRLGLMTRILNELLMYAMKRKPYIIHLTSHPKRTAAYAFYKKYGFVISGCKVLLFPN